jgi:hypothetical protein
MKSLPVCNPSATSGDGLAQQFGQEVLRLARLRDNSRQAIGGSIGGAIESLVVPGMHPGIQQPKRQPGRALIGLVPAFGADGKVLFDATGILRGKLAVDETPQSFPIRVLPHL